MAQGLRNKFSPFIKRILPIVGAGIVLATFIVKEAIREDLKDFVDAIDHAAGVYVIRNDFNNTAFQLRVIEQKVDRVEQATTLTTKDPFTLLAVNQQAMITRELLDGVETSLDNVYRLSQRLSDKRRVFYVIEVSNSRQRLESCRKQFRDFGVVIAHASARVAADGVPIPDDRIAIAKANTELINQTNAVIGDTLTISTNILKEADFVQEEKQARYDKLTKLSYFLFGFGWLLGLIGKLLGIEDVSGRE